MIIIIFPGVIFDLLQGALRMPSDQLCMQMHVTRHGGKGGVLFAHSSQVTTKDHT